MSFKQNVFIGIAVIAFIILSSVPSSAETVKYIYDDTGQLIRATYGKNIEIVYAYDKMGNRLTKTVSDTLSPSDLTAEIGSHTHVNLSWHDNSSNELGFKIERSDDTPDNFAEIAVVGPNIPYYTDMGLMPQEAGSKPSPTLPEGA